MKIDFTSDLHLDFILGDDASCFDENKILDLFNMSFTSTDADILIIAGDLSHYNQQTISFLKYMSEEHYKHVVCVHGNHDLYLLDGDEKKLYKGDSFNRLIELREEVEKLNNVYYLDGDIIEIEGIKIAGSSLWYDYSYGLQNGLQAWEIQKYFIENMKDAAVVMKSDVHTPHVYDHYSKPKTFIDNLEYAASQKEKLLKIVEEGNPDIIVSHIPPDSELCKKSRKAKSNPLYKCCFYSTDTSEFDPYIEGKTWICGHIHDSVDITKRGCRFVSSPFGYYNYEKNNQFGQIEI